MPKKKVRSSASAMNMLKLAQNKVDTPAILKKNVSNISSLRVKRWVEEIEL